MAENLPEEYEQIELELSGAILKYAKLSKGPSKFPILC